ncbi:MAG: ABC transporter substrate-binding protein [Actinomycetia bacterium]|nr:ABC transporter substrate-binding protein [Actinomycetes bacterium]
MRSLRSTRVAIGALLVAFAIIAAACSPNTEDVDVPETTTTATAAPTTTATTVPPDTTTSTEPLPQHAYGGEAINGADIEPGTLNSFLPGRPGVISDLRQLWSAGVQEVSGVTLELIPELVTELPTVANGGVVVNEDGTMTVTYTILDEAVWDDGTPISGADFQFTYETIMNPDYPISRTTYDEILSTDFGDKMFSYRLSAPTVQYELLFGVIIPKHDVDGTDFLTDWNDRRWASAGPFVFDEWATGESITAVRNENYWKTDPLTEQQLPYLDQVTFTFIEAPEELVAAFSERQLDVMAPPRPPELEVIETLKVLESDGARIEVVPGPSWEHVNFQFGPGRLERNENSCNDVYEMRLAVAQTIDREALTDGLFAGLVTPLESYVTPYVPSLSQDAWSQYPVDHQAAAQNYAKAITASGRECSVIFSSTDDNDNRVKTAELLGQMFEASGIPFEAQLEDAGLFLGNTISNGTWDLGEWAWHGPTGMTGLIRIHDQWDPAAPPPEGSNWYRWGTRDSSVTDESTVRFAELRNALNATVDSDELAALINEAEQLLADNIVFIPLYGLPSVAAVWADEIGNFVNNPIAGYLWNVEFWYRTNLEE